MIREVKRKIAREIACRYDSRGLGIGADNLTPVLVLANTAISSLTRGAP